MGNSAALSVCKAGAIPTGLPPWRSFYGRRLQSQATKHHASFSLGPIRVLGLVQTPPPTNVTISPSPPTTNSRPPRNEHPRLINHQKQQVHVCWGRGSLLPNLSPTASCIRPRCQERVSFLPAKKNVSVSGVSIKLYPACELSTQSPKVGVGCCPLCCEYPTPGVLTREERTQDRPKPLATHPSCILPPSCLAPALPSHPTAPGGGQHPMAAA